MNFIVKLLSSMLFISLFSTAFAFVPQGQNTAQQNANTPQKPVHVETTPRQTTRPSPHYPQAASKVQAAPPLVSPIKMEIGPTQLHRGQPSSFVAYIYDKNGPLKSEQLSPSAHNQFRITLIDPSLSQVLSVYPTATDHNGYYKFDTTFEKSGTYTLFAEITDKQGKVYTPSSSLTIPGKPQVISKATHLPPGTVEPHQQVGDLHFSATTTSKKIQAKQLVILDITAKHLTGEFHKALEPHMNHYAHLIAVSEDKEVLIHVDPINAAPSATTRLGGPDVRFKLRFPKPGFYRLWVLFQIDGKPVVVPYDLEVVK